MIRKSAVIKYTILTVYGYSMGWYFQDVTILSFLLLLFIVSGSAMLFGGWWEVEVAPSLDRYFGEQHHE